MKLIIVNGPSCSGKSTIVKAVLKERDGWFHLSYDSMKWQFSHYVSGKYKEDILALLSVMAEKVFGMGYSVVSDAGLEREWRESLKKTAVERGVEVIEINFEAAREVLEKRFDERVANAQALGKTRIANTSKDRFFELVERYEANKNPEAITFRTDETTPEVIVSEVEKLM